jgi:hypothetical protein
MVLTARIKTGDLVSANTSVHGSDGLRSNGASMENQATRYRKEVVVVPTVFRLSRHLRPTSVPARFFQSDPALWTSFRDYY